MKKIIFIFGTRPEAIKMAPVIQAFRKDKRFETFVISTGQHRQMLDQVLQAFHLPVDEELDIMVPDQTLFDVTANALKKLESLYKRIKPDMVMVQGDTTTAFTAALGAFYLRIPVGHIEAGLRSFDLQNPFPEEANRIFIDKITDLYFAATSLGKKNLLAENVSAKKIFVTGNTVVDALKTVASMSGDFGFKKRFAHLSGKKIILLTSHRRENHGAPLEEICKAVRAVVKRNPDTHVIYPAHLNPHVQEVVHKYLDPVKEATVLKPVEYFGLVDMLRNAYLVLTDSGGIQEEAPYFGKPLLVLRKVTERPEGVKAGCSRIIGELTESNILKHTEALLKNAALYRRMARVKNPFGDGNASQRILQATLHFFSLGGKPSSWGT